MPAPRTRRALLAAGSAAVVGLAGCITGGPADGSTPGTTSTAPDGASGTTTADPATATTGPATDEGIPPSKTVTPTGDPVSVEEAVEDEDLEYLESEGAVRYVARWRSVRDDDGSEPTREPVYETIPFEDWATTECKHVAAAAAADAVRDRLDGTVEGIGSGVGAVDGSEESRAQVSYSIVLDREGEVISEPSVPFEDVVDVAPREVSATVTLAGRSHDCTEPILVWRLVRQQG